MRIPRKSIAILIVVFLLSTLFNFNSTAVSTQTLNAVDKTLGDDEPDFDGYIIQFKEEPLLRFKNRLTARIKKIFSHLSEKVADVFLTQNVQNHKDKLLSIHRKAKEDILKLFGKDALSEKIFSRDFITIFNGLSIKNVPYELLIKIESLPYVKEIFPNYRISVALDESVPLINADDVRKMQDSSGENITGKGVTIVILDTGVNYTHPDLVDNIWINDDEIPDNGIDDDNNGLIDDRVGFDFVNSEDNNGDGDYDDPGDINDPDPMDDHGHGTHCAGIAVGKGNYSDYKYVGVAPDAKFYTFKIIDENNVGYFSDYSAAMDAAVDIGADIVSLSFGTKDPGTPTDAFCEVADNVVDAGIVVVAAAGNLGKDPDHKIHAITSPGCAQKVICVGATDNYDNIADFSSKGPVEWKENGENYYMVKPDVVAPGVAITSTSMYGGYTTKQGTSMSTPHVAGAAALILQANPDYKPDDVKNVLKTTAVDLKENANTQGSGRIDLLRAFSADDVIFIRAPNEIYEKQRFTVHITNKTGSPVKAWVLFTVPFHLPRLEYGSSVTFRAPITFRIFKKSRLGQIKVFKKISGFKIFRNEYDIKKSITVINCNRIF